MKRLLFVALLVSCATVAQAQVMETFACTLKEGKNVQNVWDTVELVSAEYKKRMPPKDGFSMFLWFPERGSNQSDFIIGMNHRDLGDMAASMAGFYTTGIVETLGPRLADLSDCNSVVMDLNALKSGTYGNKEGDRVPDGMVETFACSLNLGKSLTDVSKASDYWLQQVSKISSPALKGYEANIVTPIMGRVPGFDFGWIGVAANSETWARGTMDYRGSKEGRAADARFAALGQCQSNLWWGYWLIAPAA